MSSDQKIQSSTSDVIEGIGEFIEYWGFKKIHGKIWALIFLAESPVDASYIMKNLEISKALTSMSLKTLLDYNVVQIVDGPKATQHYQSNPQMADVILEVLINREAKMLQKIRSACERMNYVEADKLEPQVNPDRAKKLHQMVETADKALKTFVTLKQFNFKDVSKNLNLKINKGV